jgi:CBS-domain-containing membrane protein
MVKFPLENVHGKQYITFLQTYLCKMKGECSCGTNPICLNQIVTMAFGSLLGVGFIAFLSEYNDIDLLLPSFGATAVLVYAACHVPMAQPRNVIGGHFVSALVGVLVYYFLGSQWWSVAFGVTLAIVTMMVTNTLHPPGGATAFVAVYTQQGFGFIFCPVLVGAIALVVIAVLVNNLSNKCKYPKYWF